MSYLGETLFLTQTCCTGHLYLFRRTECLSNQYQWKPEDVSSGSVASVSLPCCKSSRFTNSKADLLTLFPVCNVSQNSSHNYKYIPIYIAGVSMVPSLLHPKLILGAFIHLIVIRLRQSEATLAPAARSRALWLMWLNQRSLAPQRQLYIFHRRWHQTAIVVVTN